MARPIPRKDLYARIDELERELKKRRRPRHIGSATPTGGRSGEIVGGNNKLWLNDRGTWKSVTVT